MRYRVTVRSGSAVLHSHWFTSYRRARDAASSFVHYRATIRPEFTEGEARALIALVGAVILFAFNAALGA